MAKKRKLNVFAAWTYAIDMLAMQKILEKWLAKVVASQAKYYNSKHLQCMYEVGSLFYLNSNNIDLTHPTKKLD